MAVIQFIQAQKFVLAGSGASIGDTTITLQSMTGIDGSNIVTGDLGTTAFGTLEPGNGTQEEAISFTGVTQNSNGTATLTGVKSTLFKSPYTATSGITKTHAGASTFILSNDAAFYNNIMTFVNTALSSGSVPATTSVNGIVTLSTTPASAATPIVVGDNDPRVLSQTERNYVASIVPTAIPYTVATGTTLALTATLASSISTLASGTHLNFLVPTTVASGVTLNVNSLGAKTIKKNANTTLSSGDLIAGQIASVAYDGTNFQLISSLPSLLSKTNSGSLTKDLSSTTTTTIAHGFGSTPKLVKISGTFTPNTLSGTSSLIYSNFSTIYSNGIQSSFSNYFNISDGASSKYGEITQTFHIRTSNGGNDYYNDGTVTIDSTNISIAWSKTGSPTGTAYLIWEAIA